MLAIDLSSKKILVTGASKGIGRSICLGVANAGCSEVYGLARNGQLLAELGSQIQGSFAQAKFSAIEADLNQASVIANAVASLPELDGVVLNAGIAEFLPTRFASEAKISSTFSINFNSNVLLVSELIKKRKIRSGASIILVSSISSKLGVPGTALYSASKAALSAYGRVLASELSAQKIRVNSVLPGLVQTDLIDGNAALTEEIIKKNEAQYPLGLGKTEDVTNLVSFLLSDLSRWMTGSELVIDGGHLLAR